MGFIEILVTLAACHFVCDYVFQGDVIATGKNRLLDPCKFGVNWWYWMTSHAVTHAVGVSIVTGSFAAGCSEFVAHWLIDWGKCEKCYALHTDQIAHIACKAVWILVFVV